MVKLTRTAPDRTRYSLCPRLVGSSLGIAALFILFSIFVFSVVSPPNLKWDLGLLLRKFSNKSVAIDKKSEWSSTQTFFYVTGSGKQQQKQNCENNTRYLSRMALGCEELPSAFPVKISINPGYPGGEYRSIPGLHVCCMAELVLNPCGRTRPF